MKMQFHHAGRQFFFITIAIERHPKVTPAPQGFGGAAPVPSPQSHHRPTRKHIALARRFPGGARRPAEPQAAQMPSVYVRG